MALEALTEGETDMEKKIAAVGVVAMMMSRVQHVQLMCDNGDLKKLPDQLLMELREGTGKTKLGIGEMGLDFDTAEFDLLIVTLVCILKACTYKVLRKSFLERAHFLNMIARMMYNIPRPRDDVCGTRMQKEEQIDSAENIAKKSSHKKSRSSTRASTGKS